MNIQQWLSSNHYFLFLDKGQRDSYPTLIIEIFYLWKCSGGEIILPENVNAYFPPMNLITILTRLRWSIRYFIVVPWGIFRPWGFVNLYFCFIGDAVDDSFNDFLDLALNLRLLEASLRRPLEVLWLCFNQLSTLNVRKISKSVIGSLLFAILPI